MDSTAARRIAAALGDHGGYRWYRAPGRVNLMGDHTDYNEGFVLPAAIQLECVVAARPAERLVLRTLDDVEPEWSRYVDGVAAALTDRGMPAVAIEGVVASSVPAGSGLSSSAALEVAVALALCGASGFELAATELALACQEGEHRATGVPSGIMDQLASIAGRDRSALLLDCRSLELRHVAVPREVALLVVHSGIPRTLADSEYAARRAECERIARELAIRSLRDASLESVAHEPLARHVVTENARVHATAGALENGDLFRVGELFLESHASLRDDYRVSTPELDTLVACLVDAGATGARLTGAGFGGCVAAVAHRERADDVLAEAAQAYLERTGLRPTVWICEPAPGAGPLDGPSQPRDARS